MKQITEGLRISSTAAKKQYDPNKCPPDIEMAISHGAAKSIGKMVDFRKLSLEEQKQVLGSLCPCCGLDRDLEKFELCAPIIKIADYGTGYVLLFTLIKFMAMLLVILIGINVYKVIKNLEGEFCFDSNDTVILNLVGFSNYCIKDWITTHSIANYGLQRVDYYDKIAMFVYLIGQIVLISAYYVYSTGLNIMVDKKNDTPSDWTIMLTGVDANQNDEDILAQFDRRQLRTGGTVLAVEKINSTFKLDEFNQVTAKVGELMRKSREVIKKDLEDFKRQETVKKSQLLKKEKTMKEELGKRPVREENEPLKGKPREEDPATMNKEQPLVKTFKAEVTKPEDVKLSLLPPLNLGAKKSSSNAVKTEIPHSEEYKLVEREMRSMQEKLEEMKKASTTKRGEMFTGVSFITFKTKRMCDSFLEEFGGKPGIFARLIGSNRRFPYSRDRRLPIEFIEAVSAPNPNDILYENLGTPFSSTIIRTFLTFFATFVLVGICFGILLLLKYLQRELSNSNPGNGGQIGTVGFRALSILISLFIIFINTMIAMVIRKLTVSEKHITQTKFYRSLFFKILFAQFINTNILLVIIQVVIMNPNGTPIYGKGGLMSDAWFTLISQIFITPIFQVANPGYLFLLFKRCRLKRSVANKEQILTSQEEAHTLFEDPIFDPAFSYSMIIKLMFDLIFFQPIFPLAPMIGFTAVIILYWAMKYRLFFQSQRPITIGESISESAVHSLTLLPLVSGISNMIFDKMLRGEINVLSYILFGFGCLFLLSPMYLFIGKLFPKALFNSEASKMMEKNYDIPYEELRFKLATEYDRCNPMTKAAAMKEYFAFMKTKCTSKAQQQEFQNNFLRNQLFGLANEKAFSSGEGESQNPFNLLGGEAFMGIVNHTEEGQDFNIFNNLGALTENDPYQNFQMMNNQYEAEYGFNPFSMLGQNQGEANDFGAQYLDQQGYPADYNAYQGQPDPFDYQNFAGVDSNRGGLNYPPQVPLPENQPINNQYDTGEAYQPRFSDKPLFQDNTPGQLPPGFLDGPNDRGNPNNF